MKITFLQISIIPLIMAYSFYSYGKASDFNTRGVCLTTAEVPKHVSFEQSLLTCTLSTTGRIPKIIIAGEIHEYAKDVPHFSKDLNLQKSQQSSSQFWRTITSQALKGEFLMASEGIGATMDAKDFVIQDYIDLYEIGHVRLPLEGELEVALAGMIHVGSFPIQLAMAKDSSSDAAYLDGLIDNLLITFARNNYLQMAWKRIPRPFSEPVSEHVASTIFDKLTCFSHPREFVAEIRKLDFRDEIRPLIRKAFVDILFEIYAQLGQIAEERLENKHLGKKLNELIRQKIFLKDSIKFLDAYVPVVNEVREQKMIQNLGLMYCAMAAVSKDIYVQVGNAHATVLATGMRKAFLERGLDPSLIELIDTTSSR